MAVAGHLGIRTREYDRRIRTFIPDYEAMLDAAASAIGAAARPIRRIVDLGIGSGALAERCLAAARGARVVGIDSDDSMLALARRRLSPRRAALVAGDFSRVPLPPCDAMVASFSLHHIATRRRKQALYRRAFAALARGGVLVSADCCVASNRRTADADRAAWLAHLSSTYGPRQARTFLDAWAGEDHYQSLDDETAMLRRAGFVVDLVWRRHAFAVLAAWR